MNGRLAKRNRFDVKPFNQTLIEISFIKTIKMWKLHTVPYQRKLMGCLIAGSFLLLMAAAKQTLQINN